MHRAVMKPRLLLCVLLSIMKFCYGQDEYCGAFKNKNKRTDIKITLVDLDLINKPIPMMTEITDWSVLREQDYSRELIEVKWDRSLMSTLFASVGDTAKIILKKLPGKVTKCAVFRENYESKRLADKSTTQTLLWKPTGTCSFAIHNISSEFFSRWHISTSYETNDVHGILQKSSSNEICYLMDATEKNPEFFNSDNNWKISNRTTTGVEIKIYGRLGVDRGIVIKPQVPKEKIPYYNEKYNINPIVRKCVAIHLEGPQNKTYYLTLQKNQDSPLNPSTLPVYTGRFYSCEFMLPVLETRYLGRWEIITYFNDNYADGLSKQIDTLEIIEITSIDSPIRMTSIKLRNNFEVIAGDFVLINHLNECYLTNETINECKLINTKTNKEYILTAESNQVMKLVGKCGVRMRVFRNNYQDRIDYWRLEAYDNNGHVVKTFDFAITVQEDNGNLLYPRYEVFEGENGWSINPRNDIISPHMEYKKKIMSCELEFSNGTIILLTESECMYKFNITISESENLSWFYSFEKSVKVTGVPLSFIKSSGNILVTELSVESDQIRQLIFFEFDRDGGDAPKSMFFLDFPVYPESTTPEIRVNPVRHCQLTFLNDNSSSTILHSQYKNGRYGFELNSLTGLNYGLWKFSIDYNNGSYESYDMMVNRYVEKNKARYRINSTYTGLATHVIFGDKFTINCSENVPLNTCRIENPVRVVYSIRNETLLKDGKCEMTVESADYNHHGEWMCDLLTSRNNISTKSLKFNKRFYVAIHNPQLFLGVDMDAGRNKYSASILCEKLEQDYFSTNAVTYIDGCRWIHPDGRNISKNSNDHTIIYDRNTCKITLNRLYKSDFGLWKCFLGYGMPDSTVTLSNSIKLVEKDGMVLVQNYSVSCGTNENAIDCKVSPPKNINIRSCHWIRPDNTSFFPNVFSIKARDGKYESSVMIPNHPDICRLRFDVTAAEDVGKWTCLVNLTNSYTDIITGTVEFPKPDEESFITPDNVPVIVLGGAFLVIIMFLLVIYGIIQLVRRYLDSREAELTARPTSSASENPLSQNPRLSGQRLNFGPTPRRTERPISRRNPEVNERLNQQRPISRRPTRPVRRTGEETRREVPEERRQPRTNTNPGPESLTARRAACPNNVYIDT